jgi:hypothetical protein
VPEPHGGGHGHHDTQSHPDEVALAH